MEELNFNDKIALIEIATDYELRQTIFDTLSEKEKQQFYENRNNLSLISENTITPFNGTMEEFLSKFNDITPIEEFYKEINEKYGI